MFNLPVAAREFAAKEAAKDKILVDNRNEPAR
jgi:hypothetical protein